MSPSTTVRSSTFSSPGKVEGPQRVMALWEAAATENLKPVSDNLQPVSAYLVTGEPAPASGPGAPR